MSPKNFLSAILLSITMVSVSFMTSCKEDNTNIKPDATEISVTPSELTFDAAGGKQDFELKANGMWTITTNSEWCAVSQLNGSTNKTVSITVAAIPANGIERTATIIVKSSATSQIITVTQRPDGEPFVRFNGIEDLSSGLVVQNKDGDYKISIEANTKFIFASSGTFVKSLGVDTLDRGVGKYKLQQRFRVEANPTGAARTATIDFKYYDKNGENTKLSLNIKQVHQSDHDALMGIYDFLGGMAWTNKGNWGSNLPLSKWDGVEANDDEQVTGLSLNQDKIGGLLPPELYTVIAKLPTIKMLKITQSMNTMPDELFTISTLETLDFGDNRLKTVPVNGLLKLKALNTLIINGNSITNLDEILKAELSIKTLDISNNGIKSSIPTEYSESMIGSLKEFNLQQNKISSELPAELANLANLTLLDLSSNFITGTVPASFATFGKMASFNVENNDMSGVIPSEVLDRMKTGGKWSVCTQRGVGFSNCANQ